MPSFPRWDDRDTDPLTEELEDIDEFGVEERSGRCPTPGTSCLCIRKTKARRVTCGVVTLLAVLVIAGGITSLTLYMNGYFIPECDRNMAFVFYEAVGNFTYSQADEPVHFKHEWSSCGSHQNGTDKAPLGGSADLPLGGLYLLDMAVGTQNHAEISFSIDDTSGGTVSRVSRKSTSFDGSDILSRTVILPLEKNHRFYAVQSGTMFDHENYTMTSWSGVRLDEMLSPLHVFASVLQESMSDAGKIMFKDVDLGVNSGSLYNASTGTFKAAANGVYFFTFSTGLPTNSTQKISLNVNDESKVTLYRADPYNNGIDSLSRSALVELKQNDQVTLKLEEGNIYSSSQWNETTFSGFLYSPSSGPQHCWSVYLDHDWNATDPGVLNPVPFNKSTINKGDLFNPQNHTVYIKQSGLYYVYASVGLSKYHKVYVHIMHNKEIVSTVARFNGFQAGEDQLGRGALVHAKAGDSFHLWEDKCPGCGIQADSEHKQTTFFGLLLRADD